MFDKLMALVPQLYPTGRAFKLIAGGYREAMHRAIASQKEVLLNNILGTFDAALPDNDNFTAEDATAWERRLGLVNGTGLLISDRKAAIKRKMNYPGKNKARGHYLFLQHQLQEANFNVFVYENRYPDGLGGYFTKSPFMLGGGGLSNQHGDYQHGDSQHGSYFDKIIANKLEPDLDAQFNVGYNLRSTFFIGGEKVGPTYAGETAEILASREREFRQLVLRLKPTHTIAYLFIDYI